MDSCLCLDLACLSGCFGGARSLDSDAGVAGFRKLPDLGCQSLPFRTLDP